ncbi:hypothetical protein LCGC14_1429590 [marine sediment metagenome]|uniref:Uncharacterized protein n=1 Tax=marine sediment metagenome TaxID=412755 RepID=A0A0F9MQS5_9ZZZZ
MNLSRKRAHLDETNTIRFGRLETISIAVGILIAVSTVVGNFFIGNERSERNTEAIAALTIQVQAQATSLAVIVNNNSHQDQEISEIKADVDRHNNKTHNHGGSK